MSDNYIYKALKQIKKGTMKFHKLNLICQKLVDMQLINPVIKDDELKGYELTINGKIFIWDSENWKL